MDSVRQQFLGDNKRQLRFSETKTEKRFDFMNIPIEPNNNLKSIAEQLDCCLSIIQANSGLEIIIQDRIEADLGIRHDDYNSLINRLLADGYIELPQFNLTIAGRKFLNSGGYIKNKYLRWVENPDNLWKVIIGLLGIVVTLIIAFHSSYEKHN